MQLQPRGAALALNNITLCFGASCAKTCRLIGYQMRLLTKENGKIDQNFLYREIEARARPGAQVEWMQDDWIEEGKARTLLCLKLPAPPRIPFWATGHCLYA